MKMTSHLQNLQNKFEHTTQFTSESPSEAQDRKQKVAEHKSNIETAADVSKQAHQTEVARRLPSTGLRLLTSAAQALYNTYSQKNPFSTIKWLSDWAHIMLDPPLIKEDTYVQYLAAIFKSTGDISSYIKVTDTGLAAPPLPLPQLDHLTQFSRITATGYRTNVAGTTGIYNALPSYALVDPTGYKITNINEGKEEEIYVSCGPDKEMDEHGCIWYTISVDGDVLPELVEVGKTLNHAAEETLDAYDSVLAIELSKEKPDKALIARTRSEKAEYLNSKSYQTLRLVSYILVSIFVKYHDDSKEAKELLAMIDDLRRKSPKKYKDKIKHLPDPTDRIQIMLKPLPVKKEKFYDVTLPKDVYTLLDSDKTHLLSEKALRQLGRGQIRKVKLVIKPRPVYKIEKLADAVSHESDPGHSTHSKQPSYLDLRGYGWKVLRSMVPTDAPKKLDGSYVEAGQKFEHEEESPGLSAAFSLITTPVSSNQNVTVRETRYSKLTLEYWARRVESERGATRMALTLYKILMYLSQFQRRYVRPISSNEAIFTRNTDATDWFDTRAKILFPLSASPIAVDRDNPPRWNLYACTMGTYLQWITGERRDEGPLRSHVPVFLTKKSCSSYWDVWARVMLACPFPFLEFSWYGSVHRLAPYATNQHKGQEQRMYQQMWQKISIDGKFSPNIIFIVADAVDDEDSAVHVDTDTTVGTIANAPGLIPPNPVVLPAPLDIIYMLMSRSENAWRTWTNLFREFANIADSRDVQLAINAYKATSNVCLHVDNVYDFTQNQADVASSAHFRYTDQYANSPFRTPPIYTQVSPQVILNHFTLSTLPPGYGINDYIQLASSQRPVLELPESSDLKIAMRMVQMTGPTEKMSIGNAFIEKLLIPEITFHINSVLITEFEKFVAANGVHMAEVSFSAFSLHKPRYPQYIGLEPHILDRMQLLWECKFIPYSGKATALIYDDYGPFSLVQLPGQRLIAMRRSHLPWFDRLVELKMMKQYKYGYASGTQNYTSEALIYNKTERGLWSENEAIDTYIRRSMDPSFSQENYVGSILVSDPSGQQTVMCLPVVTRYPVLTEIIQRCAFSGVHPTDTDLVRVMEAYWPDTLSDRYNPYWKSQITHITMTFKGSLGQWSNPVSSNTAMYKQMRNYGLDNSPEILIDGTDDQVNLLVE